MRIDRPGIHMIPEDAYHADPAPAPSLSRGTIFDLIYRSPAHARLGHPRLNPQWAPDEDTKFDRFRAAHDALLCGMERVQPLAFADWRKKEAKDARTALREAGKLPVLTHQYEQIKEMVAAARAFWRACPDLADFPFEAGTTEVTVIWFEFDEKNRMDPLAQTWCRARLDWISNDKRVIVDYKGTDFIGGDWPRRAIVPQGLDLQEHWYKRASRRILSADPSFLFLVQETEPPYACRLFGLEPAFQEIGMQKCEAGLRIWRDCMRSDEWPSYPNRISWVEPTAYQMADAEALS